MSAAINQRGGWINNLFDNYQLFPVLGNDKRTLQMLSDNNLAATLTKLVLNRTTPLSSLVNSLTGLNLISLPKNDNIISEAYRLIEKDLKSKSTITNKIANIYRRTARTGMLFSSVKENVTNQLNPVTSRGLSPLFDKIDSVNEQFLSVSGIICRIDSARAVAGATISKALSGSGIYWVLTDYPYFAMGQPEFHNGVILLDLDKNILDRLEDDLPFCREVGWFPYVRVSGVCKYPFRPSYTYPAIAPSWIEYRTPKNPEFIRDQIRDVYPAKSIAISGNAVMEENPIEILTYLDVIHVLAKGAHLELTDLRWLDDRIESARGRKEAAANSLFLAPGA